MTSQLEYIRANFIGRTVTRADYLPPEGSRECGRSGHILVLRLDNGTLVLVPVDGDLNESVPVSVEEALTKARPPGVEGEDTVEGVKE